MKKLLAAQADYLSYSERAELGLWAPQMSTYDIAELWSGGSEKNTGKFLALGSAIAAAITAGELRSTRNERNIQLVDREDFRQWLSAIGEELPAFWFPTETSPASKTASRSNGAAARAESNDLRIIAALGIAAGYLSGDDSKDARALCALLEQRGESLGYRAIKERLAAARQLVSPKNRR